MRFDSLTRLIGSADFSTLRELALLCLHARGFSPEITDGPDDGGRDLRVFTLAGGRRYAVQCASTQRDWRSKLREDARKAKDKLGVSDMLFVSSQRLPEVDFQLEQDDLAREGVTVQKMDQQGIASLLQAKSLIPKALEIFGIHVSPAPSGAFERPNLRQEVVWSYAFFGIEPDTFRRGVVDRAIVSVVAQAGGTLAIDDVVNRVAVSLGLSTGQRAQVRSAIDRLRQSGAVGGQNGTVRVSDAVRAESDALRTLRERAREEFIERLADALGPWVRSKESRRELADLIGNDVSALLLDNARVTANALAHNRSKETFTEAQARARRLSETLMAFGLDGDHHRDALLAVAGAASSSPLGRQLLAGEVFVNLLSLKTSQLLYALAGGRSLRAVLDASVAIPLLAGLLYEFVPTRYSAAAQHAFDQLRHHRVEVMVPSDHVEEMASHLYEAWSYRELVAIEPDLRASQNALVSHFVTMGPRLRRPEEPAEQAFTRYLAGFGFQPSLARGDFLQARIRLQAHITSTLARYGIQVERLFLESSAAIEAVRGELEQLDAGLASRQGPLRRAARPDVLLRHDARTIAWLDTRPVGTEIATVFCTWDRLIFELYEMAPRPWEALNPAQLGDALMLAAPDEDNGAPPASVLDVALSLADEDAEHGAQVLDRLVRIERSGDFDAQRIAEASAFKRAWLDASHRRPLEVAWAEWKQEHLLSHGDAPPSRKE